MNCDLCNTAVQGTIVKAGDMSNAVRKGFNPYKCGLIPEIMRQIARPGFEERWAQRAIDGDASHSDWNVCNACMAKLKPYLQDGQQAPQDGTTKDAIDHAAVGEVTPGFVWVDRTTRSAIEHAAASLIAEGASPDIANKDAIMMVMGQCQNVPPPKAENILLSRTYLPVRYIGVVTLTLGGSGILVGLLLMAEEPTHRLAGWVVLILGVLFFVASIVLAVYEQRQHKER